MWVGVWWFQKITTDPLYFPQLPHHYAISTYLNHRNANRTMSIMRNGHPRADAFGVATVVVATISVVLLLQLVLWRWDRQYLAWCPFVGLSKTGTKERLIPSLRPGSRWERKKESLFVSGNDFWVWNRKRGNHQRNQQIVCYVESVPSPTTCQNLGFAAEIVYLLFVISLLFVSFHSCLTNGCQQITNKRTKVVRTDS
jgi:hypothetical protein